MSTDAIMPVKLLLVLALVLGFGFRELWSLQRDKKKPPPDSSEAS